MSNVVLITPIIAEEYKPKAMAHSEEFGKHWMLILWRTLKKDNSTSVQPLSPLHCSVSAIVQELQL